MKSNISILFSEVGAALKPILRSVKGDIALLFIQKDDAVAAVVAGQEDKDDPEQLLRALKLFQERLATMIEHAESNELSLEKGDNTIFINNPETGKYRKEPFSEN